jgi:aryl-alcohol dehydrogenase-like predicted oxidoreductase
VKWISRLAVGTAQFGLDYGITNQAGRVPEQQAREILEWATSEGIDTIDTAHSYGESEAVIGGALPDTPAVRIVTKTPHLSSASYSQEAREIVRASFTESLQRLRRQQVYALLVHNAEDLIGPFGDAVWAELQQLKSAGAVEKIGVSTYDGPQIDVALARYPVDVVQLPYNVLDQRLVEGGQLSACASANVEVHARSLFLQGLLLLQPQQIPDRFAAIRDAVDALDREFEQAGLSRLEGLIADALTRPEIGRLVCGVTSQRELEAISLAEHRASRVEVVRIPRFFNVDARLLNPARWDELEHRAR